MPQLRGQALRDEPAGRRSESSGCYRAVNRQLERLAGVEPWLRCEPHLPTKEIGERRYLSKRLITATVVYGFDVGESNEFEQARTGQLHRS